MKPVLVSSPGATEAYRELIFWAVQEIGLGLHSEGGVHTLSIPEPLREVFHGRQAWSFTFAEPLARDDVEQVTCLSELGAALMAALRVESPVAHARPAVDPQSVHEITTRLFDAYEVEGGHVHLGGCELEDRPFLRLTFFDPQRPQEVWHRFVGPDGKPVSDEISQQLHLDVVAVCEGRRPRLTPSAEVRLREAARTAYSSVEQCREPLLETVVWCHYVRGKLTFEIGEATADLAFCGWAQQLEPPPLVSSENDCQGFRVAATDDGVIAPVEAILTCEESGQRALRSELVVCRQSGRRVLRSLTAECPISGDRELAEQLRTCRQCGQQVGPWEMVSRYCTVCHRLPRVAADDPRVRQLQERYPGLARWRKWRLGETRKAWIFKTGSLARNLLVVVDRQTLEALRLAVQRPLRGGWRPLPPADWPSQLQ